MEVQRIRVNSRRCQHDLGESVSKYFAVPATSGLASALKRLSFSEATSSGWPFADLALDGDDG